MKKSVKILALILAISFTVVCFAACGKKNNDDNQDPVVPVDPTPSDPTPVDPTPVDPTPVTPTHPLGMKTDDQGTAWAVKHDDVKTLLSENEVRVIVNNLANINATVGTSTEEYNLAIQIGDVTVFVNLTSGNATSLGKLFSLDSSTLAYIKQMADKHFIPYNEPAPTQDPSGSATDSEVPANPSRPATDKQVG